MGEDSPKDAVTTLGYFMCFGQTRNSNTKIRMTHEDKFS